MSVDLNDQTPVWRELVPENEDVLQSVVCVNQDKLIVNYMHDCKVNIRIFIFFLKI